LQKNEFYSTICIFVKKELLAKFAFLPKIVIIDQNMDFWPTFGFLIKIWIFAQNLYFDQNFYV